MDASLPFGDWPQEFSSPDPNEIPLVTLGTGGKVEVIKDDGNVPPPAVPFVITSDDNQPLSTVSNDLATTAPITQLSPSMATSATVFLSQGPPSTGSGTISESPIATTTLYTEATAPASPSESTSMTTILYTDNLSSLTTNAVSSGSTVTVYPSSYSTPGSSSAGTTLLGASSSLLTSAISSSSFISSTISSSLSSSFAAISSQTIAISTSFVIVPSSLSSFSSSSLSSSTMSNSSTVLSSTSSTSSSQSSSQTIPVPSHPGVASSNLKVHSAPYYVGIILGTIVSIALVAALIAWWIRLQSHARRRRAARTLVPWARLDDDDSGGLEAGHGSTGVGDAAIGAMHLGSREDLANVQAWTPRGDRDVGEPKRSDSYFNGSTYSLHNHAIPGHNLFSDESLGALSSFDGYHPSSLRPSQRQLPAHLIDEDAVSRAMQDGSHYNNHRLSVANAGPSEVATPWNQKQTESPSRSMVDRLRDLGKPLTDSPLEGFGSLPLPGEQDERKDLPAIEAWSSSVRSSLVNAFNAVATNLAGAPRLSEDDRLSAPPKRITRKSIRETFGDEKITKVKGDLVRDDSFSTVKSKAWILEEFGNGTGVVHIKNDPIPRRPAMPKTVLSFGDGESILTYDDEASYVHRIPTHESQIPLIASSKPQPVHIRPDAQFSRRNSGGTAYGGIASRNSSVYSALSFRSADRTAHGLAQLPHMPPGIDISKLQTRQSQRTRRGDDDDSVVLHPDTISRLSSTDSSVVLPTSHGNLDSSMLGAAQALGDRQKRALREDY